MSASRTVVILALLVAFGGLPSHAQDNPPPQPALPPPAASPENLVKKSVRDLSNGSIDKAVKDDVKALRRGPLLIHGNYCGIGNRPGTLPIDALDAACERHDACTHTGTLPSCTCDNRLREEANEIAQDPKTPAEVQALAVAMVGSMTVLVCK